MPKTHTSVVYFHGIGAPDRNTSVSHFLDYFDKFGQSQNKADIGKPRDFSYRTDVTDDDQHISYVSFKRVTTVRGAPHVVRNIRVYEAYWAPTSHPRFGLLYAVFWSISRVWKPFEILASRSWRSFSPLKVLSLHQLATSENADRAQRLERAYRDFENWEARSEYVVGSYRQFLDFLSKRGYADLPQVLSLCAAWRSRFYETVRRSALLMTSAAYTLVALIATFVMSAASVLLNTLGNNSFQPTTNAAVFLLASAAALPVIAQAFRRHLQDVFGWTIESEKDARFQERRRVIDYARNLLRHVVSDENCDNCIIVSHSLGTSIAMEATLLEGLLQQARSSNPPERLLIEKVSTIFTFGSPIDIIFYLFHTDRAASHRHSRLEEERRPSVGLPPFRVFGTAGRARVVNFWSRFDPLSGRLFSLRKSLGERSDAVRNVEVMTGGVPFRSHTSYFEDQKLMRMVYWTVMTGRVPEDDRDAGLEALPDRKGLSLFATLGTIVLTTAVCGLAFAVIPLWGVGACLVPFLLAALVYMREYRRGALALYVSRWGAFLRR